MKSRARQEETSFELKYCERCGGLWLRPAGGEQTYCTVCARAMAELPPSSVEIRHRKASLKKRPRAGREIKACALGETESAAGGAA
jgi:Zn-finger nucleic acid-binding protein